MSFRERMKTRVSNAEVDIQIELQNRGLNAGMTTQVGFTFDESDGVKGTTVDFCWKKLNFVVFIDGPHHLKNIQRRKDERIDAALRKRGIWVLRLRYTPPLTKGMLEDMCDTIEWAFKVRLVCDTIPEFRRMVAS